MDDERGKAHSGHWKALTDNRYIGAWDLEKDVTVTIERVEQGELEDGRSGKKTKKPLVYFKGAKRPLVLNATNAKTIVSITGSAKCCDWVGQPITLYASTTQVGGESKDCVRIRPTAPKRTKAQPVATVEVENVGE